MSNRLVVNVGFGNMVPSARIVAMVSNDSSPVRRLIQESREKGSVIDATQGRRTRAVIVLDSGHIVLSAIQPDTIAGRLSEPILNSAARLSGDSLQDAGRMEEPDLFDLNQEGEAEEVDLLGEEQTSLDEEQLEKSAVKKQKARPASKGGKRTRGSDKSAGNR